MSVLKTLRVTFTCDGCGKQEVVDSSSPTPKNWSWMEMVAEVGSNPRFRDRLDACDKYCLVRGLEKLLKIEDSSKKKTKAGFFALTKRNKP